MMTPPETGVGIAAFAGVSAALGNVADELAALRARQDRVAQEVHWFTIPPQAITLSAGAGTLNVPTMLGPRTGRYWDVRRISCTGFTAGTVTVYLSQNGAEQVAVFSTAGILLNGKAQIFLGANDALYFSAASITGSVTVSIAGIEISAPCIGDYLL